MCYLRFFKKKHAPSLFILQPGERVGARRASSSSDRGRDGGRSKSTPTPAPEWFLDTTKVQW